MNVILDALPRLWYVLWWALYAVLALAGLHIVVVRPLIARLDSVIARLDVMITLLYGLQAHLSRIR